MKLLSYLQDGHETWGAVVGDGVVSLAARTGHATLADFLGSADFDRRDALVKGLTAELPLEGLHFLPVIPRAEKIVCAVRNYMDHHQELTSSPL
jgi:2-keto-4-pentenoate hydratase/2-oxohepta-3-ene-1,7-dioic acid hydratase in catechol pathway